MTMENFRHEKRSYNYDQVELFRILREREQCTADMIHRITGIPAGSLGILQKDAGISSGQVQSENSNRLVAINRARKVSLLKEKYKNEIGRLFGPVQESED